MTGSPLVLKLEQYRQLSEVEKKKTIEDSVERIVDFDAGSDIVAYGSRPANVHLLIEGWAARYKIIGSGDRHIMAYLIPGDLCDVHVALLDRMDHAIAALSPCKVGVIRLSRMVTIGARSADKRTSHYLCEMLLRCRAVGLADGDNFEMPLSQQEVADTMGMSAVHMNRTLMKLRRDRLIQIRGKRIVLSDLDALMKFADFDPLYLHQRRR